MIGKKTVPLLPILTLLPQKIKQVKTRSEARVKTSSELSAIVAIRKSIMQKNILSQKTSFDFSNLFVGD